MSLFLGSCLVAITTFGAETVSSFVKGSLGFDVASIPFGASTNSEYQLADAPLSPSPLTTQSDISWRTNAVSGKYSDEFPNRLLRFGFRDGRLVAARISLTAFSGAVPIDAEALNKRRKELIQIQEQLGKVGWTRALNTNDSNFRMGYGAMCAPTAESVFLMEFHITPAETKKTSQR